MLRPLFIIKALAAFLFLICAPVAVPAQTNIGTSPQAPDTVEKSDSPHPIIAFEHREYDLGRRLAGTRLEYTFIVYNKGTADLHIQSVKAG